MSSAFNLTNSAAVVCFFFLSTYMPFSKRVFYCPNVKLRDNNNLLESDRAFLGFIQEFGNILQIEIKIQCG